MIKLETERLIIRNYKTEDYHDIYDYFSHEEVARYEDFYPMSGEEVKEQIDEWKDKDSRMVVEIKDQHKVIGSIGYFIDEDGDYSIDYDFNPIYGKKGYATEAGKELVRYLFSNLGVKKLYADCDTQNENSWKLLERLGFQRIGRLDNESYKEDANGNPILVSIYLYRIG